MVLSIGIIVYQKPTEDIIKLKEQEQANNVIKNKDQADALYSNNEKTPEVINDTDGIIIDDRSFGKNSSVNKKAVKNGIVNMVSIDKVNPSEKNNLTDATITPSTNVLDINKVDKVIAETKPVRKPTVTEKMIAEEAKKLSLNNNQTALAINTNDENLNDEGVQSDRKLKIKSVGDLVNFVVSKVDKREEKVIRVSKTDESDNEITGINLGIFKFRKAEK
jgi:hypothetical protein